MKSAFSATPDKQLILFSAIAVAGLNARLICSQSSWPSRFLKSTSIEWLYDMFACEWMITYSVEQLKYHITFREERYVSMLSLWAGQVASLPSNSQQLLRLLKMLSKLPALDVDDYLNIL